MDVKRLKTENSITKPRRKVAMTSHKKLGFVGAALALLMAVAVGQTAWAQAGQGAGNPVVFNPEYIETAAKKLLPEAKLIASGSTEFNGLVEKFSQDDREAQIKRILPLDRARLHLNPVDPVPFTLSKPQVKLFLPETAVLRSSFLQALIRGNGNLIAPVGIVQISDKFYPATLQGEASAPTGKIYLSLYDDNNKVVAVFAFPQEITIGITTEVLRAHGPEDRFSAQYTMYFTAVVLMNISAFLMN
jgi:hypothetical protein